ncbi:14629_t:CDS:2, partial [Cetraspora pellucida]
VSLKYPSTDFEGYAVIYNFIDNENYSEEQSSDIQIQKLMKDKARVVFRESSNVNCQFFDKYNNEKIQVIKDQQKCRGFKVCPFAYNHIINYKHTSVDFDSNIFQTIKNADESRTFPHIDDNRNSVKANLIHLPCDITFYQLTPVNLIKCPYVALVSISKHTYLPPPPSHIPEAIINRINKMINNASEYLDHITLQKIISIGETTNIAESAYANINHDEKELSLMNAIKK